MLSRYPVSQADFRFGSKWQTAAKVARTPTATPVIESSEATMVPLAAINEDLSELASLISHFSRSACRFTP